MYLYCVCSVYSLYSVHTLTSVKCHVFHSHFIRQFLLLCIHLLGHWTDCHRDYSRLRLDGNANEIRSRSNSPANWQAATVLHVQLHLSDKHTQYELCRLIWLSNIGLVIWILYTYTYILCCGCCSSSAGFLVHAFPHDEYLNARLTKIRKKKKSQRLNTYANNALNQSQVKFMPAESATALILCWFLWFCIKIHL